VPDCKSAQWWSVGGIPYHSPNLHLGPCNSVGMRPRTDTHTDTQSRVTTVPFASSTCHATCNNAQLGRTPPVSRRNYLDRVVLLFCVELLLPVRRAFVGSNALLCDVVPERSIFGTAASRQTIPVGIRCSTRENVHVAAVRPLLITQTLFCTVIKTSYARIDG